jgi:hypothetical protein
MQKSGVISYILDTRIGLSTWHRFVPTYLDCSVRFFFNKAFAWILKRFDLRFLVLSSGETLSSIEIRSMDY